MQARQTVAEGGHGAVDPKLVELCRRIIDELRRCGYVPQDLEVDWDAVLGQPDRDDLATAIGRAVLGACGYEVAGASPSAFRLPSPAPAFEAPAAGGSRRRQVLAWLERFGSWRPRTRPRVLVGRRRERAATVFTWVQNVGAVLILFGAWQIWGTAISQHHAQSALAAQFSAQRHRSVAPAPAHEPTVAGQSPITLLPASARLPDPPEGTVMAQIQIPAIGVNQYVVSGTADADLSMGPGHYQGTALPGQAGNVAVAGHRTTHGAPFYRLGQLVVGDTVLLTTTNGEQLTYVVSQPPTAVSPSDTAVLGNFGDNRLTLTTCTPPFSASQRLVVVASLRLPGIPAALEKLSRAAPRPYRLATAAADTSTWNWGSLPPVLVASAVLVGLGLGHRRLSASLGRSARWLVLAPTWAAALYFLFQALTSLLPPSV